MMKNRAFIAFGSNLGDRALSIEKASQRLKERMPDFILSHLYESPPWGMADQPDFLNAVGVGAWNGSARELFYVIKEIEQEMGRTKTVKNGPREIDLDLIAFGDQVIEEADLVVPHPRMCDRDFVLVPLREIDPHWTHPQTGETLSFLLENCEKTVRPVESR